MLFAQLGEELVIYRLLSGRPSLLLLVQLSHLLIRL